MLPSAATEPRPWMFWAGRRKQLSGEFPEEFLMNLNLSIGPLMSLVAGILILVMPRLLNYIVALYLIVMGLLGLFGTGNLHLR